MDTREDHTLKSGGDETDWKFDRENSSHAASPSSVNAVSQVPAPVTKAVLLDTPAQHKWKVINSILFTILAILVLFIGALFLVFAFAPEFGVIFFFLAPFFLILLYVLPLVATINVIVTLVFQSISRGTKKEKVFGMFSAVLSAFVASFLIITIVGDLYTKSKLSEKIVISKDDAIAKINNCEITSVNADYQMSEAYLMPRGTVDNSYGVYFIDINDISAIDAAARAAPKKCETVWSSKAFPKVYKSESVVEATELLNSCKVSQFYYSDSGLDDEAKTKLLETGIISETDGDNVSTILYADAKQINTITLIAQSAQEACRNKQF